MRVQLEHSTGVPIPLWLERTNGTENDIISQRAQQRNKLRVNENIIDFTY